MKTLYVSDLDGTLLRSDETISPFTAQAINNLVANGMLFSYATARSYLTASRVTRGIDAKIPLIVYNGAFVVDNASGEILISNFFDSSVDTLLDDLIAHDVYPIVYSLQNGKERFSYIQEKQTRGMKIFNQSRAGDPRENQKPLDQLQDLHLGEKFVITCIDEPEKLEPLFRKYRDAYHCIYHRDIYSGEQWLEILPKGTSKSNALLQLKALLGCDRIIAFGDGKNDMDMFRLADYSCAMENAVPELKAIASQIIGSNDNDGVVRWLLEHI